MVEKKGLAGALTQICYECLHQAVATGVNLTTKTSQSIFSQLLWWAKRESVKPQTWKLRMNLFALSSWHPAGWMCPILNTEQFTSKIAGYPNTSLKANSHSEADSYLTMD